MKSVVELNSLLLLVSDMDVKFEHLIDSRTLVSQSSSRLEIR